VRRCIELALMEEVPRKSPWRRAAAQGGRRIHAVKLRVGRFAGAVRTQAALASPSRVVDRQVESAKGQRWSWSWCPVCLVCGKYVERNLEPMNCDLSLSKTWRLPVGGMCWRGGAWSEGLELSFCMFRSDGFRDQRNVQSLPDYGERRAPGDGSLMNVLEDCPCCQDSQAWRWLTRRPCAMARAVVASRRWQAASIGEQGRWPVEVERWPCSRMGPTYVAAQREAVVPLRLRLGSCHERQTGSPLPVQAQSRLARREKFAPRAPVVVDIESNSMVRPSRFLGNGSGNVYIADPDWQVQLRVLVGMSSRNIIPKATAGCRPACCRRLMQH